MKRNFLFLFFISLFPQMLFSSDFFPFHHRDIVIFEGTEAALDQLIHPALNKNSADQMFHSYSISHLYLAEGARLIVREPAEMVIARVFLLPKSGIYSLGQPIRIHSERFVAVHCGGGGGGQMAHATKLLNLHEKMACMGRVDTTLPAGTNGVEGAAGLEGASSKLENEVPSPKGEGKKGEKGECGEDGKAAGSLFLQVTHFEGGHFAAAGSRGGDGGTGGRGGKGGAGLKDLGRNRNYANALSASQTNGFINGGKGGIGGDGGDGGNGGSGGAVQILFETKSDDAEEMLVIENQRGERGEGGSPGKGGEGGDAGQVWTSKDKAGNWGYVSGDQGDVGHDGTAYGKAGEPGFNGSSPKLEYRKYAEQE